MPIINPTIELYLCKVCKMSMIWISKVNILTGKAAKRICMSIYVIPFDLREFALLVQIPILKYLHLNYVRGGNWISLPITYS